MIAPLDLPVRRLFRSLSLSVPWRGGSNGSGTDTATIATGAGANSDTSSHDNFAAAVELQAWPIPPSSSSSLASSTTNTARPITTLAEDEESFPDEDKDQLTRLRMHSARPLREKYPHHHQLPPQTRSRASSRGSFDSSRSRSRSSSTTSSTLSGDGLTALKQPQERQRACENCWKEFWG
ncbi:hypothetical protein PG993_012026 [Apiospora rasikravindrae]|uniref:Uncharacterized protein n=1 Tax=Apiospora rasikravindrae TaxID=990691 RepID=A0ABR1S2S1_9PEZI